MEEVDAFIVKLPMFKRDPEQHFHISSTYKENGGIGDIEISVQHESQSSNMPVGGRALLPGENVGHGPG